MVTKRSQPGTNAPAGHPAVLLGAGLAEAFSARLAAVFFDDDAKRPVVHEIRDAIRKAAERAQREPAEVEDDIFTGLMAEAARRAGPPGRNEPLEPPRPLLSGDELDRKVLADYPAPIARPYRALLGEMSSAGGFGSLLDVFEGLVHYLSVVAVAAYHRSGLDLPACNRQLVGRFIKRSWSSGDLFGLLRDTVAVAGDCAGVLPYAELPAYLFTPQGKPTASCLILEGFISVRNRVWGHGAGRTGAAFAPLLPEHRSLLEGELARLSWLSDWALIRPVRIDDAAARIVSWVPLMGESPRREQVEPIPLDPRDLDPESGLIRGEKSLLLVAPDRARYLPLFPLSLFSVYADQGERKQGVYLLQRCDWAPLDHRRALKDAHFVAYESGLSDHKEPGGDAAARRIEQMIERLEAKLPRRPGQEKEEASLSPPPAEDPDLTLPQVRAEQEGHLRSFVGREDLLREVLDWIEHKTEGGYLLLLGPPGQGKSALMAELARRESLRGRGGCLLHLIKSHNNPLRFFPALITQAARLARIRFGEQAYRGDLRDLRNSLLRAVEAVRDGPGRGRALIVLDALDELAEGPDRLEILPQALPVGVRVVLTCRPDIPLVEAMRVRLAGRLEDREIPPLTSEDFREMLERGLEDDVRRALAKQLDFDGLFNRLGGNPLFLKLALDRIGAAVTVAHRHGQTARVDLAEIPQTLEAWFHDIYLRLGKKLSEQGWKWTRPGRQRIQLLKLLCVARETLGYDELTALMEATGQPLSLEDCRDRTAEMSQYLLESADHRFKPWHQGLADYVRNRVLSEAGVHALEETFCRWLQGSGLSGYSLRHSVIHLLDARQVGQAVQRLLDLDFLEAKAEAGMIFDLVRDFSEAVRRIPVEQPFHRILRLLLHALRLDVQFIALHPTTLFQCLWNRCWWYDSPEAARYYDPPAGGWAAEGPPWERPGPKLWSVMARWREAVDQRSSRSPWLCSLYPPEIPLGGGQQSILSGHEHWVTSLAFDPTSTRLASGSYDATLRVWDADTGAELACLRGHESVVMGIAFASTGRHLASGSADSTVRIWDPTTGAEVNCLRGHTSVVTSVAFDPTGRRLASGSWDETVRVWDVDSGVELACYFEQGRGVTSVAFDPTGTRLALGSIDRTVRVFDAVTGVEVACLRGHEREVMFVAFDPAGRRLASASRDETVRVWELESGAELACLRGHERVVQEAVFDPAGRRLASGSADGTVRVWDADTWAELVCLRWHRIVTSVAFDPTGRRLASGSVDRTIRVWDADINVDPPRLRGHEDGISSLAFDPAGQYLASASLDETVRVWDATNGAELVCLRGHENWVTSVAFDPTGRRLASGSDDRTVRVWDPATGAELACLRGHGSVVTSVVYDRTGRRIASGSWDETVRVWDADTGAELACFREHGLGVTSLAYDPTGRRLISGTSDGRVWVWDVASEECLEVLQGSGEVAIATGAAGQFTWRARVLGRETVVEPAAGGAAVAWLSTPLDRITNHPSGRIWGGTTGKHLYLIRLENE